jgi:hypothetical protein
MTPPPDVNVKHEAKMLVHVLTDRLQVVLSHLEMDQCAEALDYLIDAIAVLKKLRVAIAMMLPDDVKILYIKRGRPIKKPPTSAL